jgi:hypothetical protein
MTSDKVTTNKVVPQSNVKCRKCRSCNETLAHVLGQCIYTKAQRIRRHDEIRDFVTKKLATMKEAIKIIEEALIPTPTGNLKPDLASLIHTYLGSIFLDPEDIRKLSTGTTWNFAKGTWLLYLSIYGPTTAVAVFRNPNTIPFCLTTDLLLDVLFPWLLIHLSTFFLDVLFSISPPVSTPQLILVVSPLASF